MTSETESTVTKDLRRKLRAATGFLGVLKSLRDARVAFNEAIQELDADTDAFDVEEFSSGFERRRSLKDAALANNAAALEVEENVFEALEEVIDEAGGEDNYVDEEAADSAAKVGELSATVETQSGKIEELTGELATVNGLLEAITAPGAEVMNVDTLVVATVILFESDDEEKEWC